MAKSASHVLRTCELLGAGSSRILTTFSRSWHRDSSWLFEAVKCSSCAVSVLIW